MNNVDKYQKKLASLELSLRTKQLAADFSFQIYVTNCVEAKKAYDTWAKLNDQENKEFRRYKNLIDETIKVEKRIFIYTKLYDKEVEQHGF
jgi:hypothetical protein